MNWFLQTKNKNYLMGSVVLGLLLTLLCLPVQKAHAATPTTEQIRSTIAAKCDATLTEKNKKEHGDETGFKGLTDACKGTGPYEENAAKKAQRAQRLLYICNKYAMYLKQSNAYSSVGVVNGGNCTEIVSNAELKALTKNLKNYPTGSLGLANDPALDCKPGKVGNQATTTNTCDLVEKYVNPFITFLSALVGIAVVIAIITGGIRYTAAGDDPQKVGAARKQIQGALVALIAYIFLYAFIQWALP